MERVTRPNNLKGVRGEEASVLYITRLLCQAQYSSTEDHCFGITNNFDKRMEDIKDVLGLLTKTMQSAQEVAKRNTEAIESLQEVAKRNTEAMQSVH